MQRINVALTICSSGFHLTLILRFASRKAQVKMIPASALSLTPTRH